MASCSIQSIIPSFSGISSSSSYSSVIVLPAKCKNFSVKKIGKKYEVCRAMVQQSTVQGGASATYAKEMERLSAKESLLLAVSFP